MEQQQQHHPPKAESKPETPLQADRDPNPNPTLDRKPGDDHRSTNGEDANEQSNPPDADAPIRTFSSRKSVRWSSELVSESPPPPPLPVDDDGDDDDTVKGHHVNGNSVYLHGSNPYVSWSPPSSANISFSFKETVVSVKDVLGRWGKRVGEATKKAEDLAGNTWQHLKMAPSFTDGALGRIAQGTKILAEGGYEKIFQQTFETVPEEQLQNSFACYLSTSAGPVMGILYVSTAKVAFCSDAPLSYKSSGQTEWSYYKVVIPLHQLKAINPSSSKTNPAEKYIQVISVDNHEFWFMGFLNYNNAVKFLVDALQAHDVQTL